MKLMGGQIIFVSGVNKEQGVVHGCNLESPYLRNNSYPLKRFDHQWEGVSSKTKKAVVKSAFKEEKFYNFSGGKRQSGRITKINYESIASRLGCIPDGADVPAEFSGSPGMA